MASDPEHDVAQRPDPDSRRPRRRMPAAAAASPRSIVQTTARSTLRCASCGSGLSRLAETRCAAALCHDCRRGLQVGERVSGRRRAPRPAPAAAATRCRSADARSATRSAAAVCRACRRAGPERVVDAGPHERMRERQRPGRFAPRRRRADRAGPLRRRRPTGRSTSASDAASGNGQCGPSTAAASISLRASARARRVPVLDQPAERSRRRQRLIVAAPLRRREFLQQRAGVQRVALSPVAQPARRARADALDAHARGQVAQVLLVQPAQPQHGAAMPADQPAETLREVREAVVAHRQMVSTWSAASRRSAKISACSEGRSAQLRVVDGQDRPAAPPSRSSSSSSRVPTVTGS